MSWELYFWKSHLVYNYHQFVPRVCHWYRIVSFIVSFILSDIEIRKYFVYNISKWMVKSPRVMSFLLFLPKKSVYYSIVKALRPKKKKRTTARWCSCSRATNIIHPLENDRYEISLRLMFLNTIKYVELSA